MVLKHFKMDNSEIEIFKTLLRTNNSFDPHKIKHFMLTEDFEKLKNKYHWCETIQEMYYCVVREINKQPTCNSCGKKLKFINKYYGEFCRARERKIKNQDQKYYLSCYYDFLIKNLFGKF